MISTLTAILLVLFYYSYGKKSMVFLASYSVKNGWVVSQIKLHELKGVIEMILIVISHLVFCYLLSEFLDISLLQLWHPHQLHWEFILLGILLGIGQMTCSATICILLIRLLQYCFPNRVPTSSQHWVTQSRAGWIRHHLDTIQHIPKIIAVIIITLQITAEETVFRGLLFTTLQSFSPYVALFCSSFLFSLIQAFLMPRKISSLFPIVGALVMGLSNAYLYMNFPNLYPLIIGHVVFFLFSLLT
jgi:membrane protease YdiL (CAAX protease family)